jgi:hypothetical protein
MTGTEVPGSGPPAARARHDRVAVLDGPLTPGGPATG